ncbi:MAG: gamma-glutamylcyclotransferase [Chitinophagaceae bacterium]|nr:gamma-glutamylcyclotransferase [Chitinophagaceae bacterium]MCW5928281.1 gamma-glutamylcyclotransferase [Chitinophagaceae bacterium]
MTPYPAENIMRELNQRKGLAGIVPEQADIYDLSREQREFIRQYQPQRHLVVYGTLAPGQINHYIISHIKGKWQPAVIRGSLTETGRGSAMGYKSFIPAPDTTTGAIIDAFVLESDELEANWTLLDDFEGDGYRRILTRYEMTGNRTGYGYVYALNDSL